MIDELSSAIEKALFIEEELKKYRKTIIKKFLVYYNVCPESSVRSGVLEDYLSVIDEQLREFPDLREACKEIIKLNSVLLKNKEKIDAAKRSRLKQTISFSYPDLFSQYALLRKRAQLAEDLLPVPSLKNMTMFFVAADKKNYATKSLPQEVNSAIDNEDGTLTLVDLSRRFKDYENNDDIKFVIANCLKIYTDNKLLLIAAARVGDLPIVKAIYILYENQQILLDDECLFFSLLWAVRHGHLAICEFLIKQKINVNDVSLDNKTALDFALEEHHLEVAYLLISKGAKPSFWNLIKLATLVTSEEEYKDLYRQIKNLLDAENFDLNSFGPFGEVPLFQMVKAGKLDLCQLFIKKGAKNNFYAYNAKNSFLYTSTALHIAARNDDVKMLQLLYELCAVEDLQPMPPQFEGSLPQTPFFAAVKEGALNAVQFFLNLDPEYIKEIDNHTETTALHIASRYNNVAMVKLLLGNGADMEWLREGMPVFFKAIHYKAIDVVKFFLEEANLHIDINKEIPLGLNAKNFSTLTPLLLAISISAMEIYRLLVERGAKINPITLHFLFDGIEMQINLIRVDERKSSKEKQVEIERCVLELQKDAVEIFSILCDQPELLNATDLYQQTPLHRAAELGLTQFAEILIAKGAEVDLKDCHDETPYAIAQREGHTAIVDLLDKHFSNLFQRQ